MEERGWSSLCGGRFLPNHWCSRAPGGPHLAVQGGCCACGGGCLQICGAHSPHQTPLATLCLWVTVTAPSATDHAWPCLRLGRGGGHFCVSPRLLALAACRVPGGLIKFDLFFSRQSILPPPPLARRPLFCPLRPWGVSDCLSACAQLRAKPGTQNGEGGVPQLQGCRGRASQAPATLLWPRIYPRSPARAPSLSHPWSRGLSHSERNVLIF